MNLRPGKMITDEVRLLKPLPASASGRVWLADQLDWRKKVVVEILEGLKAKDDEALSRFLESAAQTQELESERIARIFDFGVTDDFTPYVIMDWLKGETLQARMSKVERLEPRQVGEVVSQVSQALSAAHEVGLSHLRLAPKYIFLLDAKGALSLNVLGFGTAHLQPLDRGGEYHSPEQYLGRVVDHRADLWSLGAVTYRMLTGQVPIDAAKRRLMQWSFEPPSEMWLSDVPPEVDAWFERALHKLPKQRFESAEQMASSFADLIPGLEHLVGRSPAPQAAVIPVVDVGTPAAEAGDEGAGGDVVVQDMTDDAPGIVIDVDD